MKSALLLSITLVSVAQAALTDAQIKSVFPDATKLTGETLPLAKAFDLQTVTDGKTLLSVMEVTDKAAIGWLGLGVGTGMIGADTVIAWPTDGKWTLSHGVPTGYMAPEDLGATDEIKLLPELSTETQVAFTRPLKPTYTATGATKNVLEAASGQMFVYARSATNPGTADATATKAYHDLAFAVTPVDLSAEIKVAASETPDKPAAEPEDAAPEEPAVQEPASEKPSATSKTASSPKSSASSSPDIETPPVKSDPELKPPTGGNADGQSGQDDDDGEDDEPPSCDHQHRPTFTVSRTATGGRGPPKMTAVSRPAQAKPSKAVEYSISPTDNSGVSSASCLHISLAATFTGLLAYTLL